MEEPKYIAPKLPPNLYENEIAPIPPTATFAFIEKSVLTDDGLYVFYKDLPFPMKGWTRYDVLNDIDSVKKYLKGFLTFLGSSPVRYFLAPLVFLPRKQFAKVTERFINLFADFCWAQLRRHFLLREHYSRAIRAIYDAGMSIASTEPQKIIVKSICAILNSDPPYRYRVQDITQLLNQRDMRENPAKEIKRLFDVLLKRDGQREWKAMGTLLYWLVKMRRDVREMLVRFTEKISVEQLWFDDADLFFALVNDGGNGKEYDYLGLPKEKRTHLKHKIAEGGYRHIVDK